MKNIKKILFLFTIILSISSISNAYEDYYKKIYIVKISKKEIFEAVNATQKQQKKLSRIFDGFQKKAEKVEKELKQFEGKKEKIDKIERERYLKIAGILSYEQLTNFNRYINGKKLEFEEKNDKIRNLMDNLNLENEQKAEILKLERDFKREVDKLKNERLSEENFLAEYDKLKKIRNEKIKKVLNEEQLKITENF
ncbi:MAG: viral A-type inclusion protein [Leptotrichiaceae bacterium]|nr:viral A-type inclusion protein [Leptotrichiaceae bacterium]